jgi:hypothetical protein
MWKKFVAGVFTLTAVMWLTGTAQAIEFTHVFDPPDVLISEDDEYMYTHDLTLDGYDPLKHELKSIYLLIDMEDDSSDPLVNGEPEKEKVKIFLDGELTRKFTLKDSEGFDKEWCPSCTHSIDPLKLADGILVVTLLGTNGDFIFRQSILEAKTALPEPSTLILMGTGLVGALGIGLRRRMTVDKLSS